MNKFFNYLYFTGRRFFYLQSALVMLIFILQIIIFYIFMNGVGNPKPDESIRGILGSHGGVQFFLAANIRQVLLVIYFIFFALVTIYTLKAARSVVLISSFFSFRVSKLSYLLNFFCFLVALFVLIYFQDAEKLLSNNYSVDAIVYTLSPLIWFLYTYSVFNLFFPLPLLFRFFSENKFWFFSIVFAVIASSNPIIFHYLINFWSHILLDSTVNLSSTISNSFGLSAQVFPFSPDGYPIFGTNIFQVEITPECSGYEGVALTGILLGLYIFFNVKDFHLYRALLIMPIAGVAMFFLNSIRIAVLVAIGHFYSSDLALHGFHIVAGWLNLLIIFIFSIVILNTVPYFLRSPVAGLHYNFGKFYLLFPLMMLLAGGLINKAFIINSLWAYPIPIILTSLVILRFKSFLFSLLQMPSTLSYCVGFIIFIVWINLIPPIPELNVNFFNELQSVPIGIAILWILFRLVGASIIVPIAEEFAFRGFLLPKLQNSLQVYFSTSNLFQPIRIYRKPLSVYFSLLFTSLIFGVLHSDFLPALIAGLGYGLVFLHRRKLIDAIVAHSVTNALLALDVIYYGNWSYW